MEEENHIDDYLTEKEEEEALDDVVSYLDAEVKIRLIIPFKHGKDDGQDVDADKAWKALYESLDKCGDWNLIDTLEFEVNDDK